MTFRNYSINWKASEWVSIEIHFTQQKMKIYNDERSEHWIKFSGSYTVYRVLRATTVLEDILFISIKKLFLGIKYKPFNIDRRWATLPTILKFYALYQKSLLPWKHGKNNSDPTFSEHYKQNQISLAYKKYLYTHTGNIYCHLNIIVLLLLIWLIDFQCFVALSSSLSQKVHI